MERLNLESFLVRDSDPFRKTSKKSREFVASVPPERLDVRKVLRGIQRSDRVLQFASFNFDAIIWELVFAFACDGTLVTARREDILPRPSLIRLLQKRAITVAVLSPSVVAQMGAQIYRFTRSRFRG